MVDFVGPLPVTTSGNRYILVFTEYSLRYAQAYSVPRADAETVARFLVEGVMCLHGAPQILHSDRGTHFFNAVVRATCLLLGVEQTATAAYRPQCNGLTERFNQTLEDCLTAYVGSKPSPTAQLTEWDQFVPLITFAYNTTVQTSLGYAPFELLFGRAPRLPIDVALMPEDPALEVLQTNDYLKQLRIELDNWRQPNGAAKDGVHFHSAGFSSWSTCVAFEWSSRKRSQATEAG